MSPAGLKNTNKISGESMKKIGYLAALAVVLTGCVSAPIKPMDSSAGLQGKSVILTQYAKPDFAAMTPGKAVIGIFGAFAMIHAGNELVAKDNIADPSLEIGEQVANDLSAKDGIRILPNQRVVAADDKPATLVKVYPDADLILDVKTINWMYSYYPSQWGKYHVYYTVRMRLLNGRTGDLIAQQLCKTDPTDPGNPPSVDGLRADHSALLKQLLHKAADTCVKNMEQQTLKV
jgi:PBP1b-binding outer membrane lipoprotein LpoB